MIARPLCDKKARGEPITIEKFVVDKIKNEIGWVGRRRDETGRNWWEWYRIRWDEK